MKKKILDRIFIHPFLFDSTVMVGGGILLGFCNYIFTVVMAHVFSLSDFGEFQVYSNLISLISVIGSAPTYYAMRMSIWSKQEKERGELSYIIRLYVKYKAYIIGFLGSSIGVLLLAVFFVSHMNGTIPFFLILLSVLFGVLSSFFSGIVQGIKKFFQYTTINITSTLIKIVCAGVVGYVTQSPALAMSGFFISQMYSLFFFENTSVLFFKQDSSLEESQFEKIFTSSLVRELLVAFLFSLGLVVLTNGDVILARLVLSPEELGFMSIFLIVGKMVLFSNLALMGVVLSYAPQGVSSSKERSIVPLAYAVVGAIGVGGIGAFLLLPRFILHTLFHVPVGSFLEPILWQAGVIELLLSLLSLEANISFGRKVRRMPEILCLISIVFCIGLYFGGHSVQTLSRALMEVYAFGWFLLLTYRLMYTRFSAQFTNTHKSI